MPDIISLLKTLFCIKALFLFQLICLDAQNDTNVDGQFCAIQFRDSLGYCVLNRSQCWATNTTVKLKLPHQVRRCSNGQVLKTPDSVQDVKEANKVKSSTTYKINITKEFIRFNGLAANMLPSSGHPFKLLNVLSANECKEIISICKDLPGDNTFWPKLPRYGFKLFMSKYLADLLWSRIAPFVQRSIKGHRVVGITESIFYKQIKRGMKQSGRHTDRIELKDDFSGFSSLILIIYLNDHNTSVLEGGATEVYYKDEVYMNYPKVGTVLIYSHSWAHRGQEIFRGSKYILTTRIILENKYFQCN